VAGDASFPFRLNFWDIGGQKSIRPFWRNYFEETDAVVWVVDSADVDRFAVCRGELESVLKADRLAGASVLILANKQDCNGAQSLAAIRTALGLDGLEEGGFKHRWAVFGTSAAEGTNLAESLAWLVKSLQPK
jgi:ADP-ribosylation factor-like protein 2